MNAPAAAYVTILYQQQHYLFSSLSRTQKLAQSLEARISHLSQALDAGPSPRSKRKKLQHFLWRTTFPVPGQIYPPTIYQSPEQTWLASAAGEGYGEVIRPQCRYNCCLTPFSMAMPQAGHEYSTPGIINMEVPLVPWHRGFYANAESLRGATEHLSESHRPFGIHQMQTGTLPWNHLSYPNVYPQSVNQSDGHQDRQSNTQLSGLHPEAPDFLPMSARQSTTQEKPTVLSPFSHSKRSSGENKIENTCYHPQRHSTSNAAIEKIHIHRKPRSKENLKPSGKRSTWHILSGRVKHQTQTIANFYFL